MTEEKLKPVHPGEVLMEEFLKPMDLSQNRVALDIGVPAQRINDIVRGKRALLLILLFGWHVTLARLLNSGWGCKWIMTWI